MPIQSGEITNILLMLWSRQHHHYLGGTHEESTNIYAQLHPHLFGARSQRFLTLFWCTCQAGTYCTYREKSLRSMKVKIMDRG